jgi:hypothetical protein
MTHGASGSARLQSEFSGVVFSATLLFSDEARLKVQPMVNKSAPEIVMVRTVGTPVVNALQRQRTDSLTREDPSTFLLSHSALTCRID